MENIKSTKIKNSKSSWHENFSIYGIGYKMCRLNHLYFVGELWRWWVVLQTLYYLSPHALPTDQHLGNSVDSFSSDCDHPSLHVPVQVCVQYVVSTTITTSSSVSKHSSSSRCTLHCIYSLSHHLYVCGDGLTCSLLLHYTRGLFCPMKFWLITIAKKICSCSSLSVGGVCW